MRRKTEIDFLNTLFCILVILIHLLSEPISAADNARNMYLAAFLPWRLSAFVVQGFIFLSGMKMFLGFDAERKIDYRRFYLSRVKKIILPYAVCVLICYIYFYRHGFLESIGVHDYLAYLLKGNLASHFYFVVIIVQMYLLRPLWTAMVKRSDAPCALIIALAVNILAIRLTTNIGFRDRIFVTYLIYWVLGCFAGVYYERFKEIMNKNFVPIAVIFLVMAFCEVYISFMAMTGRRTSSFTEELHLIYCLCAIAFTYALSLKIGGKIMRNKMMQSINGASYYIYLIHCLFIYIINDFMGRYGIREFSVRFIIRAVYTYAVSVAVCAGYVWIKEKILRKFLH